MNARDLDIMEVLDKGIKSVLQKAENGHCGNVRSLRLQLNQIETILGALKDDRLDLHMPQEVRPDSICVGVIKLLRSA